MKVSDYVVVTIDRLPKGYVFTYEDFLTKVDKKEAIIKTLNRLAASGKIAKLSKGKFFKSEQTPFGSIAPDKYQIVKDLLVENGKTVGYLTGHSIYDQLGLTTQISNTIQIGRNNVRASFKRERYTISFIKQKNTITKKNVPLLQILDALRFIKRIPDTTINSSTKRISEIISALSKANELKIAKLAMKYPPATRALLGAVLEKSNRRSALKTLAASLNPVTKYRLSIDAEVLPTAVNWNII